MGFRQRIGVKGFGPGIRNDGWYIKWSPNFGLSIPWFRNSRLRIALHHGVQVVRWSGGRWVVSEQKFGKSKVIGEVYKRGVE